MSPQNNLTIYEVVKAFEIASTDDDVEIIFIDVSYLNISSVSAYEVGKSINLLKEKGKKLLLMEIFLHSHNIYWLHMLMK